MISGVVLPVEGHGWHQTREVWRKDFREGLAKVSVYRWLNLDADLTGVVLRADLDSFRGEILEGQPHPLAFDVELAASQTYFGDVDSCLGKAAAVVFVLRLAVGVEVQI